MNRRLATGRLAGRRHFYRARSQTRFVFGVLLTLGLAMYVLAVQWGKSQDTSTGYGRDLSMNISWDESNPPVITSFCDASLPSTESRIEAVTNSTEIYNNYMKHFNNNVKCYVDYSDYSSYPDAPVDPCTPGGVLFYVVGVIYMFMGLAVVCDEFFVPALEVMVEVFNLSNDVAGATLMAAGGSAPELFTSLVGTFLSKSNVGFGTIVGSAVFNVLFVIGMCAIFSKELLCLTWWPLARDSSYYAFSLVILSLLYSNGDEPEIELWEAIVLLLLYVGYVTIMKFNDRLQNFVTGMVKGRAKVVAPEQTGEDAVAPLAHKSRRKSNPFVFHNHFRSGLLHLIYKDSNILDVAKIQLVTEIKGDVKETFQKLDLDLSGYIEAHELEHVLKELTGKEPTREQIEHVFKDLGADIDTGISLHQFQSWYLQSEQRVYAEAARYFKIIDTSNDGHLDRNEIRQVIHQMSHDHQKEHEITEEDLDKAMKEFDVDVNGKISMEEFMKWYQGSLLWKEVLEEIGDGDDEGGPLDLEWPSSWRGRAMFIITAPIVIPLYFTVPDVRRDGWDKYYPITWTLAIVWIAIYSYIMVWMATLLGDAAGLSPSVMGATFLAAGTSIPDLITSVIVARNGFGDMAVSSSIGSNIFDILIGLPFPWLLFNLIKSKPVSVLGGDLFVSLMVLILMLVAVIATIAINKWKMTKSLGITMFVLYVIFLGQHLIRESLGC